MIYSPSFRNTAIQKLRNYLLTGLKSLNQFYNYLDFKTNGKLIFILGWFVPLGYLTVVTICFYQFWVKTFPIISSNIGYLNFIYIILSMILIYLSTIIAIFSDPGIITPVSLTKYPYKPNQLIFFNNKICSTCKNIKPARSKHCSICNKCYLLYDHHCIWINNCIGYYNYKWFLLFLVSNINMLGYGFIICFKALNLQLQSFTFLKLWKLITKTNDSNKITGIFIILCFIFVFIVIAFTGLHLRYIYLGVTTNELDKWGEIEYLIDLNLLYKVTPSINNEKYVEKASVRTEDLEDEIVYISLKDEKILINNSNKDNYEITPIESIVTDINNEYDNGFWNNFKDRVFI
ncbi:SWF1 [Candida pseudojiufengensis]|uniref:SWF1 n=1 Tax=Candida pseudojiufengensis TaxID=497109 RepID=UPI0022244613|nr:SWF1 [Candida pseudojiufengensis]KAI5966868.1 SWF1 [Candida pseudojiufengensis]